jgi:Integrase core domain
MEDGRCKLGLAGRRELVRRIGEGATMRQAAACLGGRAGDGAPLVASLAGGGRGRAAFGGVSACPSAAAAVVPVGAFGGGRRADPRRPAANQLRPGAAGGPGWPPPFDCLEGAPPPWPLAPPPRATAPVHAPLRVGRARGAAAHRRDAAVEVRPARALGQRPRLPALARCRQGLRRLGRRRPFAARLLGTAQLGDRRVGQRHARPRRALDARARLRPRPGRDERHHKAYTSLRFQGLLRELGARHIPTPAYTPRWNGKLERFNQTLSIEWARSRIWPNSRARDRALSSFLRYYNRRRPHTSLGDRPPISRVQQLRGQDI